MLLQYCVLRIGILRVFVKLKFKVCYIMVLMIFIYCFSDMFFFTNGTILKILLLPTLINPINYEYNFKISCAI